MGDSTAMTIEFLRARLLSERSVSRSARQRADHLAKRVLDLEEQLRIVTIQRKKAEKAATEVLAILESQGVNDSSEVIDSSSDRDNVTRESKGSDGNAKGDDTSTASRMDRSDVEDGMSGSEVEVSPSQGRSLSWKSRNSNSDSSEKGKEFQARQRPRRGFISRVESSPQHLLGKSCRRINGGRDLGSASENGRSKVTQPEHASDCADDQVQSPKETYDVEQAKLEENVSHSSEDQNRGTIADLYADGFGGDEGMEKALQQQAQLIVRYQAEENAQREWEEKYNENSSSALVPCEQHEKVDPAEDKDAPVEDAKLTEEISSINKETKMNSGNTGGQKNPSTDSIKGAAATDSDGPAVANTITSNVDTGGMLDQQCHGTAANEYGTGIQEFEFPGPSSSHAETRENQCHEIFDGNAGIGSLCHPKLPLHGNEYLVSVSTESPSSSGSSGKICKRQLSLVQNQIHRDLPEPHNTGLSNVLEALQHARLSLGQELKKLQQSSRASTADSQSVATRSSDTLGIPFGSAGLFRIPSDSTQRVDLPRSNCYDTGLSMATAQSYTGLCDGYTPNSQMETRTALASPRLYLDPVPTRMSMPTFTNGYSYAAPDMAARISSYEGLPSSSYMGVRREVSGVDGYPVYGADRSRLDFRGMQRRQD
uniref:Uncharacterized protein n=1 Tax=Anthurium amnicola TaxID=1678845 RepID=A0A1D1YD50_9ARAE